jgi:hypothetical protein
MSMSFPKLGSLDDMGESPINIDAGAMMRQATMTAHDYMLAALSDIDELLGKGEASKHPELIAAYMQTAATDFGAAIIAQQLRAGLEEIAERVAKAFPGAE